ncbi:MAG: hypothetical protein JHC37_07430 [Campylobacteraceae bacterium]|nr:hypothetical protein [Campylobacteraceae bacterium]
MLEKLIGSDRFCDMMEKNTRENVAFMLENGIEFGVICSTEEVLFEPPLPPEIKKNIKPIALFVLSNYSFESAYIDDDGGTLFFEAGFGPDNYASLVAIELRDIIQIVVEDTPVYINVCAGRQRAKKEVKKTKEPEISTADRSMEKLLSRPENKKFLK